MAKGRATNAERRSDSLSRARIIESAIGLLDEAGEEGLTFRALAARLSTGPGAIYWHVANRSELMAAATETVLARVFESGHRKSAPRKVIHAVTINIFDVIDEHPWVGAQLALSSWQTTTMLQIFELIGQQLQRSKVPFPAQFPCATAIVVFTLGAAGQNALNARGHSGDRSRSELLDDLTSNWESLDKEEYPFVRSMLTPMREHDDQEQFLQGIDMILDGAGF